MLQLLDEYPDTSVHWIVLSGTEERAQEARCSAQRFLARARDPRIEVKDFPDGYFPYAGKELKAYIDKLKEVQPDLIFTHYRNDAHQDHRLVAELTWNTFRSHLILEYEIPKYDGDFGSPSVFVPLSKEICRRKIGHLMDVFRSQRDKQWFDSETFFATLRLRGVECGASERYAEAYYCRKMVIRPGPSRVEHGSH